jgi:hypothetical protein
MLYRERRQGPFRSVLRSTRFVLTACWMVGVSLLLTLLFLEEIQAAVIATIVLVPAIGLLVEVRRRRARWERWQRDQKHRSSNERTRDMGTANGERQHPWWQVLEIPERSTFEDVKAAYRMKIKQYHPDTVMSLPREFQELADRKTKEINRAFGQARRIKRTESPPER